MENTAPELLPNDPELEVLKLNKESGYNYRQRRHPDWDENYELYRDKVTINRLTQRQSVNLPLMKQTIRTLLKDVDDMPVLYFENLDNDKEAEIFKNEYWKYTVEQNRMDLQDIVDKRQVFIFGRSFTQWQIVDGKIKMTVEDPMDILVDRYCDPFNIHSSRFLIHTHIFKPFSYLESNPEYDQEAVARLKEWYKSEMGLKKAASNEQMLIEKNKKLADMGVQDIDSPVLGETIVELTIHLLYRKEEEEKEEQIYKYTEADDREILMKKPLEKIIGTTADHFWRNHYPYDSWADDVERQDFWSDGIGDIVRTPNKVLNSWFSQLVENRTLRNFGMHYFDSTIEGFTPQTFQPVAWGWYGVPGKPADVLQKVDIPDLSESLDEMNFVITMLEKATGATATQQGVQTERQVTLGEVQLALGEAKERVKGMSKFYTPAWKERGLLFIKMIEAASDKIDAVKVYKKGKNTDNIYSREIGPEDWATKSGYRCKVWSQDEKEAQDTEALNKLNAAKAVMPDNPKLDEIYKRKVIEFAGLDPDEINDIMAFEQAKREAMMSMIGQGVGMPGMPLPPEQQGKQQPQPLAQIPAQV
jgi:hypothetical protein